MAFNKEPLNETKEITLLKCSHKQVSHVNGILRCTCGASWSGPRLNELYQLLKG